MLSYPRNSAPHSKITGHHCSSKNCLPTQANLICMHSHLTCIKRWQKLPITGGRRGKKLATHAFWTNWHSDPLQDCAAKHSSNEVGFVDGGGNENAMKQNLARATLAKQVWINENYCMYLSLNLFIVQHSTVSGTRGRENWVGAEGRGLREEAVNQKWRFGTCWLESATRGLG